MAPRLSRQSSHLLPGVGLKMKEIPVFPSLFGSWKIKKEVASAKPSSPEVFSEGVGRPHSKPESSLCLSRNLYLQMLFLCTDSFYLHHIPRRWLERCPYAPFYR